MDAVSAAAPFASSLEASRSGCTELWAITSTVSDGCALWKAFLVDLESVWQTLARTTRATWTLPGTSGVPSPAARSGAQRVCTARRPPPPPWGHSSPRATTSTIVILSRFVALSVSPILKVCYCSAGGVHATVPSKTSRYFSVDFGLTHLVGLSLNGYNGCVSCLHMSITLVTPSRFHRGVCSMLCNLLFGRMTARSAATRSRKLGCGKTSRRWTARRRPGSSRCRTIRCT